MGFITVKGSAEKEVECDRVNITLTFRAIDKNASRASKGVIEQSEEFLEILKNKRIDINMIHLANDDIQENRYRDDEKVVAIRQLNMEVEFNPTFINFLLSLIQDNNYDINLDTEYKLSNEKEKRIKDQLLSEAMKNAREKADIVVEAIGVGIAGIKSMNISNRGHGELEVPQFLKLNDDCYCDEEITKMKSNSLGAPICTKSESVTVVWKTIK